jgi:malonate decarboxylase epsilon subunit
MDQVALARPRIAWVSSSLARVLFDGRRIGADLAANMAQPVLWADTVRHAWERGARLAVEMPSGSVLTRLTAPEFPDGVALSCEGERLDNLVLAIQQAT